MCAFKPKASNSSFERELIPAATHEAYCYGVVDIGTQERKPFQGKPKDPAPAIIIFFEFPEVTRQFKEDGPEEPCVKSQQYNFTTDEKGNLAKMLKGWVGDINDVDFTKLPGTPASIKIVHEKGADDKVYDNMASISEMPAKLVPLMKPRYNKDMVFSIEDDGFDSPKFTELYEWVQKKIKLSLEYQEYLRGPKKAEPSSSVASDDDIPF